VSFSVILNFQGILAAQGASVRLRALSDMQKATNQLVAELWQQHYQPRHFEEFAARRYQYASRAMSTMKKKARLARRGEVKYGGKRALVHRGLLEEQMARRGVLRAYPTRVTLRKASHVPKRPSKSRINLHEEVVKVIPEETRYLIKQAQAEFLRRLAAYKPRRRA
jgi:hypothetical protein